MRPRQPTPGALRRVVIATRIFAPDPGAAAHRWLSWAKSIASEAQSVEVLTTRPMRHPDQDRSSGPATTPSLPANVSLSRWPVLRDRDGSVRGYIQYLSFDVPLFFRLLLTRRPDVVVCEPPPTTGTITRVACAIRRVPYVYVAADLLTDAAAAGGMRGPLLKVLGSLERFAIRGASRIIAVSPAVSQRVLSFTGRESEVVRHSVTEMSGPHQIPEGFPHTEGPVFLYAGTAAEWMGAEVFAKAAPQVLEHFPAGRIVFMGQGTGWEKLRAAVAAVADPRVLILPACPSAQARQWESAATVTLAAMRPGPYQFAYTTKVLTSLASGTPVVYAGVGPAAEEISADSLGEVTSLEPKQVAASMIRVAEAVQAGEERYASQRLTRWVADKHGSESSGRDLNAALRMAQQATGTD